MPPINKRWLVAAPIPTEVGENLSGYSPILRQILYNRGYYTHEAARQYLEARPPEMSEPANLLGIPLAVERIQWAVQRNEKIAIYGDYDADGVTATALLTLVLQSIHADVLGYIPSRFDEGYGLNTEALDTLRGSGVGLVITVDCGIRSPQEAKHASKIGLDLIITDHHHPGSDLPQVRAVINPKQPGETYPDHDLAGVGLAYKLAQALLADIDIEQHASIPPANDYLDLVALGTVADLVPLVGENRSLVRAGLEYIRRPHRQGVMSLIGAAGLTPGNLTASDIGFMLGPRLNAAGRLESAQAALQLLTTNNVAEAASLALKLDSQNRERQQITREIQAHADQLALAEDPQAMLLLAADSSYNPGVVGLVASRLTEQHYRPAIVVHLGEETARGSCRSIPEFHITRALDQVSDLLEHHGGHAAAAGFTVHKNNLPTFIERMKAIAREELGELDLRPTLKADAEIPLRDLHPKLLEDLAWLQPTGQGNPEATFVTRNLRVARYRTVGRDNTHLKFSVTDGRITYDAIAFRQGHWQEQMPPYVDLLYSYEINEYNGRSYLQLNVRDLKPTGTID